MFHSHLLGKRECGSSLVSRDNLEKLVQVVTQDEKSNRELLDDSSYEEIVDDIQAALSLCGEQEEEEEEEANAEEAQKEADEVEEETGKEEMKEEDTINSSCVLS